MTAVLVPTGSDAEWLAARRRGITASEIAIVMGLSPYSSPFKLYHQKLGALPDDDDQAVFERGRVLEPYIAEKFGKLHPEFAILGDGRSLYAHPDRLWQLATPDRMVNETGETDACTCGADLQMHYGHEPRCGQELLGPVAVLECKTDGGSDEWGEPGTDEIPVHYRCQALWQMDVMGVAAAHVACLRIRDWRILEYQVAHAEGCGPGRNMLAYPSLACPACDDIALMRGEARDFLDRIDSKQEPDVDWRPATGQAIRGLHPAAGEADVPVGRRLAIQYRAAVRRFEQAERRKDEMTNRVLVAIGDGRRAVDERSGEAIATRSVSHPKRISPDLLRAKYPAIAAECTPEPKPVIKLLAAKPKKEKTP
jgi:putative phage-type endonuclease